MKCTPYTYSRIVFGINKTKTTKFQLWARFATIRLRGALNCVCTHCMFVELCFGDVLRMIYAQHATRATLGSHRYWNMKPTGILCDRANVYARIQEHRSNVSDYGDREKAIMLVYTLVKS